MEWTERRLGRHLNLRDLNVLMTVARCGSMGKAAAQLSVSQPAVSKAVADLNMPSESACSIGPNAAQNRPFTAVRCSTADSMPLMSSSTRSSRSSSLPIRLRARCG